MFKSHLVSDEASVLLNFEVKQIEEEVGAGIGGEMSSTLARSRSILTTYAGGAQNSTNQQSMPVREVSPEKSLLMNESRLQRGGIGFNTSRCCESKSQLEDIRTENE